MTSKWSPAALFGRVMFRLGPRRSARGVPFAVVMPDCDRREVEGRLTAALELISDRSPADLQRIRRLVRGIVVFGGGPHVAEWHRDSRLIELSERHMMRDGVEHAHVAATIVHEATHAWLGHLGFEYVEARRARIEAICFRREAQFARRIPGGDALAAHYEKRASAAVANPEQWTSAALKGAYLQDLRQLNAPGWLVKWMERVAARRTAESRFRDKRRS